MESNSSLPPAVPSQPGSSPVSAPAPALLRPSFIAPPAQPLSAPPLTSAAPAPAPAPAATPAPALKPMFKPAAPEPRAASGLPPPPPPPPPRVGVTPNVAAAVEGNFASTDEDSAKVGTGWIVLNVLSLAASLALCLLLWNEFLTLDKNPLF